MLPRNSGFAARLVRALLLLVVAGGITLLLANPADARGFRGGPYWGVGVGFGYWGPWWPGYWGPWPYYPYDYYPYPATSSVTVVQGQPAAPAAAPAYYYCDAPAGYYPYVTSCTTPWRQVPMTPQ
jgi:hypothetical protein